MKYRPNYPGIFDTLQQARAFMDIYVPWYNQNHKHSGIALFSPDEVHDGSWRRLWQHRQRVHQAYYQAHPERFRQPPHTPSPNPLVGINLPPPNDCSQLDNAQQANSRSMSTCEWPRVRGVTQTLNRAQRTWTWIYCPPQRQPAWLVSVNRILLKGLAVGLSTVGCLALSAQAAAADGTDAQRKVARIQLLAINDFHGSIDPPQGESGTVITGIADGKTTSVNAGGIAYLATHLKKARAGKRYTATVAAGDLISKSPLMPTILHNEPTVSLLSSLGLDVSSVGNHEFDQGLDELLRLNRGGCHPVDGCTGEDPFPGTGFPYLAANAIDKRTEKPILPSTWVKDFGDGIKVGFIGMTLKDTPSLGRKSNFKNLTFTDEVTTANQNAAELRRQGISSIVLLIHQGGSPASPVYDADCNANGQVNMTGPIVDIATRLDPSIDAIVSGHTHKSYVCEIPGPDGRPRLVTSAGSHGTEFTDITLSYDRAAGKVTHAAARNNIVTRDVRADRDMSAKIARFHELATTAADKTVGYIAEDIVRAPSGESPMGDLVADAQLSATQAVDKGGAQIAFVSPNGIHSNLVADHKQAGRITYGQALMTQPYQNPLVTRTLTGAQIIEILRHQFTTTGKGSLLQVSRGLTYTLTGLDTVTDAKLNGVPLDMTASYRVTANGHQADNPGNSFSEYFNLGTDETESGREHEAVAAYLSENSSATNPLPAPAADRIRLVQK
jgi:5'-nucleotidase